MNIKGIIPIEFQVVDQAVPNILAETAAETRLMHHIGIINSGATDLDVYQKYKDVYECFGCISKGVHCIAIKKRASQWYIHRERSQ